MNPHLCKQKPKSTYKPIVPAVEEASRILLCLGEGSNFRVSLTDLCRQVGIYKSKGYSILNTLHRFGLVEKDPRTKTYSLGPNLIFLSRNVLENMHYPEIVTPFLESLAKDTKGTALFGLISSSYVLVVAKHEGNMGFSIGVGRRFHITLGAHGKAIAAFMDKGERKKLLAGKRLHFYGDPSRMDMDRLREEILRCRAQGFAQDRGEVMPGVHIVSAPVFGLGEKLVGCVILVGIFTGGLIEEYGPKVASAARQVSHRLGARVDRIHRQADEWNV